MTNDYCSCHALITGIMYAMFYMDTCAVTDKLAAVWPFLGICAEVAVLCTIIFIFEKRRNRKMEEEEEVDAVKQEL